jgi:glycosyltransferase involved in cell wall biosynthesis
LLVLRDPPVSAPATEAEGLSLRAEMGLTGLQFVYVGNLESYQGIDLLIDSFHRLAPRQPEARLTIVGGSKDDVEKYRGKSRSLGLEDRVNFTGPRPVADLGRILAAADVLVSPRLQGRNTPMKVYAYMQAGKPIVATAIPTHTQVLDETTAALAAPTPEAFADAMSRVAADPALRIRLGEAARLRCEREYSMAAYERTVDELCLALQAS